MVPDSTTLELLEASRGFFPKVLKPDWRLNLGSFRLIGTWAGLRCASAGPEAHRRLLETAEKAAAAKADKEAATALKKAKQGATERHAEEVAYAVVKLYQSFTTRALEFSTTVQIL